jgi:hypothetical protein
MPTLYEKGLGNYRISTIFLGNLMMLIWIVLGTLAVWFFNQLLAGLFLAFALIIVYVILRKLVCTNCYYYDKWCVYGWGKLSAKMFKKGKIENFNDSIGIRIAPLLYGLLTIIPIILIIISIILVFDYTKIGVLVLLLAISFYSGGVARKAACSNCKMKSFCRGSTVK